MDDNTHYVVAIHYPVADFGPGYDDNEYVQDMESTMKRRSFFAAVAASLAAFPQLTKAQQIVSTGDVTITSSLEQNTATEVTNIYEGMQADVCSTGQVMGNPYTRQVFIQGPDCLWYPACTEKCKNTNFEGEASGG